MGRDEREDPRGPEALHREGDRPAASDHAGDSGSVSPNYLEDASGFRGRAERVIVPADEAGVAACLREASAGGIAVTIAGAGTGITGARVPLGGWVLSLEKLDRLEVHSGYAIAGPGVLLGEVHAAAERSGQFYPPDPTETAAAIGGNIATNASGSRSYKYGSTRRWVERLRVVLADGRVMDVARGDAIDFDPDGRGSRRCHRFRPRRDSPSPGDQEHRRISPAARHGLGGPVRRFRGYTRCGDGSAPAAVASSKGGPGRRGLLYQRRSGHRFCGAEPEPGGAAHD
ncbi:hypothetical protein SBA3_2050014 [Candidatus Sulfopaludibacter sp. SbA3]|nr:hypothetical protein SBA3_2050014 [Candidatus Sulfopaludibacter sp. SbA3]